MDEITKIVLQKLEKLDDKLDNVDKTLVRNTESLEYHVLRTDMLQDKLNKIEEETKPVLIHVNNIKFLLSIGKWLGLSGILTLIGYIVKMISEKM